MQNRIINEAKYADIIVALLQSPYMVDSIIKLVFIAFCVNNEENINSYSNRKRDFVDAFISNINIKLMSHPDDISMIFSIIDKLVVAKFITVNDDQIEILKPLGFETENKFLQFCLKKVPNPIFEVNKLDARALLEEVLRYV